jgi:filamentous hemagglutinin family protein
MNRIYRLAWNRALGCFVPASEVTLCRGKGSSGRSGRAIYGGKRGATALAAAAILSMSGLAARAGPTGGKVIAGSGTITQSGTVTSISQASQDLSLNWATFNIAPRETVNFVQPSVSAIAVNRILDTNGTQILGHLNANGQVYLINPNGILFGRGAQVNVGGLIASTLDVNDAALNGNTKSFSGTGSGSVVNEGAITAVNGGSVVLLGNRAGNTGVITAELGAVALGAGRAATLTFNGDTLVHMQIDRSVLDSVAQNGGLLHADGGRVIMSAGAKDTLLASVVNNTGVIEARTVDNQGGNITLLGGMAAGTVQVGGTLDASAPSGGRGGAIETSAAHVQIADNAKVNTSSSAGLYGSWLLDPQDFTVAASGGDVSGAALSNSLATTPVVLQSSAGGTAGSGDVNVNDVVSWSANTTLTLTASNNVNVNATVTATGNTAGLIINPNTANGAEIASGTGTFKLNKGASINLPGSAPTLSIAGSAYVVINSVGAAGSTTGTDLQGVNGGLAAHYALGSNIDASATSAWNGGTGFMPIGTLATPFAGTFDGLGHAIGNLAINRYSTRYVGLFGYVSGAGVIRNIGLLGGSVHGGSYYVGGLVGRSYGAVSNSYMTGNVTGSLNSIGGLMGANNGTINNSYATGTVSGPDNTGGLVGLNYGTITASHATGAVSGQYDVGGLVGFFRTGTGNDLYATGAVTGIANIGGLFGQSNATVSNSYATGSAHGSGASIAGLVGNNYGTVNTSYSTGAVSGSSGLGGLVSGAGGTVTNSFWDITTSGRATSPRGTGLTTAGMMTLSNFTAAGWSISGSGNSSAVWRIYDGSTAPLLLDFLTPLTVTSTPITKTYDGVIVAGLSNPSYSVAGAAGSGHIFNLTDPYGGAVNAGTYGSKLYSDQQGYDISTVSGALTIDPAPLTVIGTTAGNKIYDGTFTAALAGGSLSGAIGSDAATLTLTQAGSFVSRNVGTGIAVTANDVLGGTGAGNYALTQPTGLAANITPASLTVTGETAVNKVYDGTVAAALTGGSLNGVIAGDAATLSLTQAGTFASRNAGTGIAVTANDVLGGTSAGNYTLTQPVGLAANITPASLTVTGESAANKVYDGTVAAALTGGSLSGVIAGDAATLSLNEAGVFTSKNVGTAVAVTATDSLGGTGAGNYALTQPTGLAANITPASLTVTGETAVNKVYDGTVAAALTGGSLNGVIAGDAATLSLTQAGTFASRNAGTGIAVTANDVLGGTSAGNYTLTQPVGLAANITPASLTVTGESAANKVYDGTVAAALTGGSLSGVIAGDAATVSLNEAGVFTSKNVGTAVAVTATDSLGGTGAGNYVLTQPSGIVADITPATLTYLAARSSLVMGDMPSGLSGTVSGFVQGDTQTNATSGTPAWTAAVGPTTVPGLYAIDGGGLSTMNYVFVQASANATALEVIPATPPASAALTQVDSILPASRSDRGIEDDARKTGNGPPLLLHIVNGGVKLPTNTVDFHE